MKTKPQAGTDVLIAYKKEDDDVEIFIFLDIWHYSYKRKTEKGAL